MRNLLFACGVMLISSISFAQTGKLSVDQCATQIYENTSASFTGAREFCQDRRDAKFIGCVIELYNDLDQDHDLPSAEIECNRRLQHPLQNQCYAILERAQFSRFNTESTCQWALEATNNLSVVKCAARLRSHGNEQTNSVNVCWGQYKDGELNAEGFNKVEIERARKAAEAEKARKAEAARQETLRRQAEAARLADLQRQVELKRQRDLDQRRDRLAIERAEREERERRVSVERQEERLRRERIENQRAEARRIEEQRARAEQPRVVTPRVTPTVTPRVTPRQTVDNGAADRARRAEAARRAEEERNFNEMIREENARQAREAAKKNATNKGSSSRDKAPTPKVDIPEKKVTPSVPAKKSGGVSEDERRRREADVERRAEESRRRVEQARKEAEERRKAEASEKADTGSSSSTTDQKPATGGSATGDVAPPPSSDVIVDFPEPG